jgi:hypothetical protein
MRSYEPRISILHDTRRLNQSYLPHFVKIGVVNKHASYLRVAKASV